MKISKIIVTIQVLTGRLRIIIGFKFHLRYTARARPGAALAIKRLALTHCGGRVTASACQ
jgi:putative lipase involved disintegration of autophagic bodies